MHKFYLLALSSIIMLAGCNKETTLNKPVVTNTTPPGAVTNVSVINQNGKATISYNLPSNNDLMSVKAIYETSPGVSQEVDASRYISNLMVVGFGDTLAHTVQLYAVNTSNVSSAPVSISVHPLTPGYVLAQRSLSVAITFGGFTITCKNPTGDNLAIISMVDTSGNGQWAQTVGLDAIYSSDTLITGTIRSQPSVPRKYGFVVRDRWLHYSDTLFLTLAPLYEAVLDKTKWSTFVLPKDATVLNNGGYTWPYYMWDGNLHPGWPSVYFTVENAAIPQLVTFDMGAQHLLSRLQINPYMEVGNYYYVRGNLKDFEVYGSNSPNMADPVDATNTPGASWTKLSTFHVVKPSGSPYQTETTADQTAAYNGWQFDVPPGTAAYRYIRIRQLSNWQGSYFMCMAEFTLWGQ